MNYDSSVYNYPSRRNVVYARKGMVATGQPMAAQAGLEILRAGGNAIDAAIAAAACLTVVEPTCNGIGGDSFALVWTKGKLHGLNCSGKSPKSISIEKLKERGITEIPEYGWVPVTVPGAPAGWAALSKRFGKLPLTDVLAPAIRYAAEGYSITPNTAKLWEYAYKNYKASFKGEEFNNWFTTFAPKGRAPRAGETWKSSNHAKTLELIAETNAEAFYKGELADKIDAFSKKYDGYLRKEDLEEFEPEWVNPICINYRGYNVWEIPPNGHGIVALMALKILSGYTFESRDNADTLHKQLEAMKLAFADGQKYVADPRMMSVTAEQLLSEEYAAKRRSLIGEEALMPVPGDPASGGTVYLATADEEGNMVSMIQSNYMGFGSGLVVPGTGIALHNRGLNFTLDINHDNALAPGKKPYHTIIPAFLTKDNKAVGPFGVMGGFMQPQGHVQVVMNTIDFHMNPQDALDAYRWQWVGGKRIDIEPGFPNHLALQLAAKGHDIVPQLDSSQMGRGQIIWRDEDGTLCGGTEPRTDGTIASW
ncbi:MAG: gamma-glutamyltransferase [Clostridia bacterium BRH_c25]|nr:MAG: gamma-glutamyltransferase [Clostridia bacterium BRH_c25]